MQSLGKVGKGVGTAIGVPLTGLAMVQAARSGRDPLAVLRTAMGEEDPLNSLQQAQLEQIKKQGLLAQIEAATNPQKSAYLRQSPEAAKALGFNVLDVPVPGTDAGPGMISGPDRTTQIVDIPQVPMTPQQRLQAAQAQWLEQLQGGLGGGQPGVGQGGLTPVGTGGGVGTLAAPSAPASTEPGTMNIRGQNFRIKGYDARGMPELEAITPKVSTKEAGTINPTTGKPYEAGQRDPTGAIVETKLGKTGQAAQGQIKRIDSALAAWKSFTTPVDGVRPIDVTESGKAYGGIPALAKGILPPSVTSIPTRVSAQRGDKASAALVSGGGQAANIIKAFGDSGNIAEQEQMRAIQSLIPGPQHSREMNQFLAESTPRLLMAIREGLSNGTIDEKTAWGVIAGAQAEAEGAAATGATPAPTPATPGAATPGADLEAALINRHAPKVAQRGKGGKVAPKQLALVGEHGPELSISDQARMIVPLQQMAQAQQMVPGPKVLGRQVMVPAGQGAPMQLQGLQQGQQGLTPQDALRATQGGMVIMQGPDGQPVIVPR